MFLEENWMCVYSQEQMVYQPTQSLKMNIFIIFPGIRYNSWWRYIDDPTPICFDGWNVFPVVDEKPCYFML